eukprot:Gb_06544 [translate_table: standard]
MVAEMCIKFLACIEAVKILVGADLWENQHDIRELTSSTWHQGVQKILHGIRASFVGVKYFYCCSKTWKERKMVVDVVYCSWEEINQWKDVRIVKKLWTNHGYRLSTKQFAEIVAIEFKPVGGDVEVGSKIEHDDPCDEESHWLLEQERNYVAESSGQVAWKVEEDVAEATGKTNSVEVGGMCARQRIKSSCRPFERRSVGEATVMEVESKNRGHKTLESNTDRRRHLGTRMQRTGSLEEKNDIEVTKAEKWSKRLQRVEGESGTNDLNKILNREQKRRVDVD